MNWDLLLSIPSWVWVSSLAMICSWFVAFALCCSIRRGDEMMEQALKQLEADNAAA